MDLQERIYEIQGNACPLPITSNCETYANESKKRKILIRLPTGHENRVETAMAVFKNFINLLNSRTYIRHMCYIKTNK